MAANKHGGLGKGLGALLGNMGTQLKQPTASSSATEVAGTDGKENVQSLALGLIQPNRYQPREDFDEAALEELKDSVQRYGILQPVLVRKLPAGKGYELVAGERRFRAAKAAGLKEIPALVREYNDTEISEIALIENLQREDLSVIEQAKGCQRLIDEFHLTQEQLAKAIGVSRTSLTNNLRLLSLAPEVQDLLANGVLSAGQARPLAALKEQDLQRKAADYIQEHDLTARQCEQLAKKLAENPNALLDEGGGNGAPEKKMAAQSVFVEDMTDRLTQMLGTQVRIKAGKKKSRIEIEFYSEDDLERIVGLLSDQREARKQSQIDALRKVSLSQKFNV